MSLFLALIDWFHEALKFVASAAFGAMVVLISVAMEWLDIQRKREE